MGEMENQSGMRAREGLKNCATAGLYKPPPEKEGRPREVGIHVGPQGRLNVHGEPARRHFRNQPWMREGKGGGLGKGKARLGKG